MASTAAPSLPKTFRAIQVREHGNSPDVLQLVELPLEPLLPAPKSSDILVKLEWSGLNFIDTYLRSGLYPPPGGKLPFTSGVEGAGKVVAVSEGGSSEYKVGDKVALYGGGTLSEFVKPPPTASLTKVPDGVTTKQAAAGLIQGLTALSLVTEAHELKRGEWALVHAIAGGTGLLLLQIAKARGAHVVGTCSTEEKAELARQNGADHVFVYGKNALDGLVPEILAVTPDKAGFHAIFDGVGKDFVEANFKLVRRKGSFVTFGNASGAVPPVSPLRLAEKNVKLSRPKLNNYIATPKEVKYYTDELWKLIASGDLKLRLHKEEGYGFSEEEVRAAQAEQEGRGTTGKLIVKIE